MWRFGLAHARNIVVGDWAVLQYFPPIVRHVRFRPRFVLWVGAIFTYFIPISRQFPRLDYERVRNRSRRTTRSFKRKTHAVVSRANSGVLFLTVGLGGLSEALLTIGMRGDLCGKFGCITFFAYPTSSGISLPRPASLYLGKKYRNCQSFRKD